MSSIKKNILQTLKTVILALVFIAGVNYASAINWTAPGEGPPGGNTQAPLNVTNYVQEKLGPLLLNTAIVPATYGLIIKGSYNPPAATTGRLGIGTIAPTRKLHVAGDMRLEHALYDSSNNFGTNGQVLTSLGSGDGVKWETISGGGGGGGISGGTPNQVPKYLNSTTLTNSVITENSSGQIGIGTMSPGAKLDVNGNVTIRGNGAGFLPVDGYVLTATNSTGLAAWERGVEVGAVRKTAGTTQICGLTPSKRFLATVSGSYSYTGVVPDHTITVTVNGVTGSLTVYPVSIASGNPGALYVGDASIPVVVNSDGSGCVQVTSASMSDFNLSIVG